MARHASALKRHRQNLKQRARNRQLRSKLRTAIKSMRKVAESPGEQNPQGALEETQSLIDRMVAKGIIHRNTAARHKSRLVKRLASRSAAS